MELACLHEAQGEKGKDGRETRGESDQVKVLRKKRAKIFWMTQTWREGNM